MMPGSILFLLTQDIESPSGGGRYLPMAKEFAARGWKVDIAALHPKIDEVPERNFNYKNITVHYLSQMHVRKQANRKEYYSPVQLLWIVLKATYRLTVFTLTHPTDWIFVCKPHPMNSIAGILGKVLRKQRLLLDCDDNESASNRFSGKWQSSIINFFERSVPHYADKITTNTMDSYKRIIAYGVPKKNIFYLPNGFDNEQFNHVSPQDATSLRAQLDIEERPVILYVGSLSLVNHPIDLLIKAFSIVLRAIPKAFLIIVGGGEDFDILKSNSADLGLNRSILFTGHIPKKQVAAYYCMAQVSLDPVRDDAAARARSPLKLFESWAFGTPVITGDVGDRKLLAGIPPAVLLIPPGDYEAIAKSVIQVLLDTSLANQLRTRGYERVRQYSWSRLMESFIESLASK